MYFNWGMKYINDIESYEAFKQEYLEDEKVNRMKSSVVLLCFVLVLTVFFQEAAPVEKGLSCLPTLGLIWLLRVKIKARRKNMREKYLDL